MTKPRITCTRRLEFDAGHRVVGHESKCSHLHGHRYVVDFTCAVADLGDVVLTTPCPECAGEKGEVHDDTCPRLKGRGVDTVGRVVDFGVVKRTLGAWIDTNLDHGLILWEDDPLLDVLAQLEVVGPSYYEGRGVDLGSVVKQKVYVMDTNPTAENLADHLLEVAGRLFGLASLGGVECVRVRVWETPNCYADAVRGDA